MAVAVLLVAGCGTAEWVHPNKPKDEFIHDYNQCETEAYQNPKVQGGMKFLLQQSIDRCLAKKGWVLRQKR
ncbi:MAG: hypothetical protein ACREIE_07065 [Nitrospiraceae bacterium]